MEWKNCYLDMILVPSGLLIIGLYHLWLWNKVRVDPLSTIIDTNSRGRKYWVSSIMRVRTFFYYFFTISYV